MISHGQRVTLRNVYGIPLVTGTLHLERAENGEPVQWALLTEFGQWLTLVGVGYESAIEAAIVAVHSEAA